MTDLKNLDACLAYRLPNDEDRYYRETFDKGTQDSYAIRRLAQLANSIALVTVSDEHIIGEATANSLGAIGVAVSAPIASKQGAMLAVMEALVPLAQKVDTALAEQDVTALAIEWSETALKLS